MRYLLVVILCTIGVFINAQTLSDSLLRKKILNIITDSSWNGAIISIYAKNLKDNSIVFEYNSNLKLNPASCLKIVSTALALQTLTPSYRYKTEFYLEGQQNDSIFDGNLIIKGYGDPTLYSNFFKKYYLQHSPFDTIAEILIKLGIKKINGKIIADASLFGVYNIPNSTWIIGDVSNYYGATVDAINIFDNEYSLYFSTKDSLKLLSIEPNIPIDLNINVSPANINSDQSVIYGDIFDSTRIITGLIPANRDTFEVRGSIPNPPLIAARFLYEKLKKYGIDVSNYDVVRDTSLKKFSNLLYVFYSPPLKDIVYYTNKYSVNLFAEALEKQVALSKYKNPSDEMEITALKRFIKPIAGDIIVYDACGLSRYNAISSGQLVDVLTYMYKNSSYKNVYFNSLPIAGESGTLAKYFRNTKANKKVFAKTGTMSGVKALCGYAEPKKNTIYAFSIIINNYIQPTSWINSKIEEIVLKLFFE